MHRDLYRTPVCGPRLQAKGPQHNSSLALQQHVVGNIEGLARYDAAGFLFTAGRDFVQLLQ